MLVKYMICDRLNKMHGGNMASEVRLEKNGLRKNSNPLCLFLKQIQPRLLGKEKKSTRHGQVLQ